MAKRKSNKRKKKSIGFWGKLLIWLNILAAISLMFSWASTYVDPAKFWPVAFIAMAFPLIVITNLFFILIWIVRLRVYLLISLIPVLFTWGLTSAYFRLGLNLKSGNTNSEATSLRVSSFNVHTFDKNDYYNFRMTETPRKIIDWVYQSNSDIVLFQEFYSNGKRNFNMLDSCKRELRLPHFKNAYYRSDWKTTYLASFSAHRILDSGELRDEDGRAYALWTDIQHSNGVIRFINVHLQSVRLAQEMDIFDSKIEPGLYKDPEFRKDAKSLLRKLKRAFVGRSGQTRALRDFVDASEYPVVLCGDLNDAPASYTYRVLSKGMKDAFKVSGRSAGTTYTGRFLAFRIDYIITDPSINTSGFRTTKLKASDHYPLTVDIYIEE